MSKSRNRVQSKVPVSRWLAAMAGWDEEALLYVHRRRQPWSWSCYFFQGLSLSVSDPLVVVLSSIFQEEFINLVDRKPNMCHQNLAEALFGKITKPSCAARSFSYCITITIW